MYSQQELLALDANVALSDDLRRVQRSLVNKRVKQPVLIEPDSGDNLSQYVEAVLASAPAWAPDDRSYLCTRAAEIAEALASQHEPEHQYQRMRFRAALLYELASLPALSASVLEHGDVSQVLYEFFEREGAYKLLDGSSPTMDRSAASENLGEAALLDDVLAYADVARALPPRRLRQIPELSVSESLRRISSYYDVEISATEAQAFIEVLNQRMRYATISNVPAELVPSAKQMHFPLDLLPAQAKAITSGMLNPDIPAWGFASPTGSGKTFLTRLAIADTLRRYPESKVLYLVPSRALVAEVGSSLAASIESLGHSVIALSAQLLDLDTTEATEVEHASVVVLTPEKADLLARLGTDFLRDVAQIIVDEAHHIESGTRGALLELYLWRLKHLLPPETRFQFLSAVAPNIGDITNWMSDSGTSITYNHRPTRMRVGVYSRAGTGKKARGVIRYVDQDELEIIPSAADSRIRQGIAQLAAAVAPAGPVLIVAKGKRECENIADTIAKWLSNNEGTPQLSSAETRSDVFRRLDSSLEREMYQDVPLRPLVNSRIAYHHAGLPPRVRQNVEQAIRHNLVQYVVATTTLAEGVNFPFSTVIIQSLSLREPPEKGRPSRYSPVTPRTFWNIAGRAGRPGFDAEGQVILFEPSLGLDKIDAVIDPYLRPELSSLEPVESALAYALSEIKQDIELERYSIESLEESHLPPAMSRRARGAINLVRIGVVHARASAMPESPEDILEGTFAAQFLNSAERDFGKKLFASQDRAVRNYLDADETLSASMLADLGLSLETLYDLKTFVEQMQDWQIQNISRLFYGRDLNLSQAPYVVGPVAKRMSELEGRKLGGFLSDAIVQWLSGVTFSAILKQSAYRDRLEDLIALIYSRVQFLLPWGLWATDLLMDFEAKRRGINYDGQVKKLAYLADAGVPNFDALRLTHLGFERVDATRLSNAFMSAGGHELGVDVIGWLVNTEIEELERVIRGIDGRRAEFGFRHRVQRLRGTGLAGE